MASCGAITARRAPPPTGVMPSAPSPHVPTPRARNRSPWFTPCTTQRVTHATLGGSDANLETGARGVFVVRVSSHRRPVRMLSLPESRIGAVRLPRMPRPYKPARRAGSVRNADDGLSWRASLVRVHMGGVETFGVAATGPDDELTSRINARWDRGLPAEFWCGTARKLRGWTVAVYGRRRRAVGLEVSHTVYNA